MKLLTAISLHKLNEKLQSKSFYSTKDATFTQNMKNRGFNVIILVKFFKKYQFVEKFVSKGFFCLNNFENI